MYATYENREPVSMIMDLTFKELEPIYDQDYFDEIHLLEVALAFVPGS